jgi:hypothetical protein
MKDKALVLQQLTSQRMLQIRAASPMADAVSESFWLEDTFAKHLTVFQKIHKGYIQSSLLQLHKQSGLPEENGPT